MKIKSVIFLVATLGMCAFSCKTILLKKFNANQKFNFKTKEAYVEYLKANKFDTEMFIYPDSASYLRFIGNIESATVYYNSFVSDSISIKKSEFLKDNESCTGRISIEIEKILAMQPLVDTLLVLNTNISTNTFFYLNDNAAFKGVNTDKKLSIFLLHIYETGTYYNKLYREIEKVQQENKRDVDLYIISLAPVYWLKNK